MGDIIDAADKFDGEVFSGADQVPGLNWELSEGAKETIRAIDENIRAAEQISGHLTVG